MRPISSRRWSAALIASRRDRLAPIPNQYVAPLMGRMLRVRLRHRVLSEMLNAFRVRRPTMAVFEQTAYATPLASGITTSGEVGKYFPAIRRSLLIRDIASGLPATSSGPATLRPAG